jgi:hypothetical protein
VPEDRDEIDRQDAEEGSASKDVEGFDAIGRRDGRGHSVSLARSAAVGAANSHPHCACRRVSLTIRAAR